MKKRCSACKRAFEEGEAAEGRHIRRRNKKFSKVMGEMERGELMSNGKPVRSRKQAAAIAYSELKRKKKKKTKKKK